MVRLLFLCKKKDCEFYIFFFCLFSGPPNFRENPPTPVPGFSEAPTQFPLEPGEVAANPYVSASDDI